MIMHIPRRVAAAGLALVCVVFARPIQAQEAVELLLHSGKIFTADDRLSTFSAIAVRDGRIVALGWDALRQQYRAARSVDLGGRLVVPGFIDTHIHISGDPER
jgi:predicted amidohydrolase YtcJ